MNNNWPASQFIRISRTHIVNKNKITSIDSAAIMLSKIQLQIGKTYHENVQQSVLGNAAIKDLFNP
ncbi:MAG: LytTR family transcriptional regulator DNA-binding domain-containing protein [Ferruginibacter sp.]